MATELEIRVTAELREIKASLATLSRDIGQVGVKANASAAGGRALAGSFQQSSIAARGAAREAGAIQGAISGAVTQAKLLVGSLGLAFGASALVNLADTATRLRGQLGLVTKTQGELNAAMAGTLAIANRTRQGLEGTASLYARIARTTKGSQEQTLALTESINQAVALSFTSATAADAALFQLGQGLGSGTLRGEELNSVLEQTPRLAQAIAEGLVKLGKIKDPGGLRAYANLQGIAATDVVRALSTQQETLRGEFQKLPPTISNAFTVLKNNVLAYIGEVDKAEGASRKFADAVLLLANNIDKIAGALVLAAQLTAGYVLAFRVIPALMTGFGLAVAYVNTQLALNTPLMRAFQAQAVAVRSSLTGAALAADTFSLSMTGAAIAAGGMKTKVLAALGLIGAAFAGWQIGKYLVDQFLEVQLFGIALAEGLTVIAIRIGGDFKRAAIVIKEAFLSGFNVVKTASAQLLDVVAKAIAVLPGPVNKALSGLASAGADAIRQSIKANEGAFAADARLQAETTRKIADAHAIYSGLADAAIESHKATGEAVAPPKQADAAGTAVKGLTANFELLKDAAERALVALEHLYEDAGISIKAYYAEKTRLQQASIDADIATARAEAAAATTPQARADALRKIIILERARRDVVVEALRDQGKAEEDLAEKMDGVRNRLLSADGQTAKARAGELEAEFKDLLARLKVEADQAGIDLVHKLINVEAAKAGLDQLSSEFSQVTGALSQLEATTAAQVSAGLLSNATAEKRTQAARADTITQLEDQRVKVQALYDAYGDDKALLQLQAIDQQLAQLSISADDFRGKIQDAGTNSLTTFFKELASGAVSAGDAVRNLAVNFTQALAAMAAEALAKRAIGAIFDAFSGDKATDDGGVSKVASAAAAGLAYAAPVTGAALAMTGAGATLVTGAAAVTAAAVALSAAASTLLIANSASIIHTGGIAGQVAGSMRSVSPLAFLGAPRYHTGGIAGVRANEVAAVLQRGEEVITKQDPRHRYNGGQSGTGNGQRGTVTTPVVAFGDNALADALAGHAGESMVVTHVRNNWNKLSQGAQ